MESFLVAINAVIPFLCYITFGYGAKARGVLEEDFLQKLNKMVFRLLYPFMTFYNIYKADASMLPRPLLLIFAGAGGSAGIGSSENREGKSPPRSNYTGDLPQQFRPVRPAAYDLRIR